MTEFDWRKAEIDRRNQREQRRKTVGSKEAPGLAPLRTEVDDPDLFGFRKVRTIERFHGKERIVSTKLLGPHDDPSPRKLRNMRRSGIEEE